MPGVNVPSSPNDPMKTILPAVGSAVGTAYGGPAGGVGGAKLGRDLTGGGQDPSAVQSSAIDRRVSSMQDDPSTQLAMAGAALRQMSPEDQAAYGPTIAAAQQRAQGGQ